jgi:hypothetical protein
MTCCSLDVIARNISVPGDLQIQDWICFSGMGAYTYAMVSHFNSMQSAVAIHSFTKSPLTAESQSDSNTQNASSSNALPLASLTKEVILEEKRPIRKFARNQF